MKKNRKLCLNIIFLYPKKKLVFQIYNEFEKHILEVLYSFRYKFLLFSK
jgi:hypothetical protein